jgi:hypothetical protein
MCITKDVRMTLIQFKFKLCKPIDSEFVVISCRIIQLFLLGLFYGSSSHQPRPAVAWVHSQANLFAVYCGQIGRGTSVLLVLFHQCSIFIHLSLTLMFLSQYFSLPLFPARTCSRMSLVLVTEEPVPVQSHTSLPSVISHDLSQPALFQVRSPPFPMAVQIKVLVVENLEASIFIVLPQSAKHGFSPKRACFGQSGESDAT